MGELLDPSREKIRVLIADADNISSQLMASALRRCRNSFDVVAVASSSPDAIRDLGILKPNCAVVNCRPRGRASTGFKVLRQLAHLPPTTAAIMLLHSTQ